MTAARFLTNMDREYQVGHAILAISTLKVTNFRADALVLPASRTMRPTNTGIHNVLHDAWGPNIFGKPDLRGRAHARPGEAIMTDASSSHTYRFMIHSYGVGENGACDKVAIEHALGKAFALIPGFPISSLAIPLLDDRLFIGSPSYLVALPFALAGIVNATEKELKTDTALDRVTILLPNQDIYTPVATSLEKRFH
jgi:hypothetical protein